MDSLKENIAERKAAYYNELAERAKTENAPFALS